MTIPPSCSQLLTLLSALHRLARKVATLMEDALREKVVILVSTVPLDGLRPHFQKHMFLRMSWTEELHESCVYSNSVSLQN